MFKAHGATSEQAQWPRMLGGDNFIMIGLPNQVRPASAGAMVGIDHAPTAKVQPQCWLWRIRTHSCGT